MKPDVVSPKCECSMSTAHAEKRNGIIRHGNIEQRDDNLNGKLGVSYISNTYFCHHSTWILWYVSSCFILRDIIGHRYINLICHDWLFIYWLLSSDGNVPKKEFWLITIFFLLWVCLLALVWSTKQSPHYRASPKSENIHEDDLCWWINDGVCPGVINPSDSVLCLNDPVWQIR